MGYNYRWERQFTSAQLLDFLRGNPQLFNPQQWLLETMRIMLCSESTGQYTVRTAVDGHCYRVAKTRNGVMPDTVVSTGLRAPLWQAISSFAENEHLRTKYDVTGTPVTNYLAEQTFALSSDYAQFSNLFIYSADKMCRWVWRVLSVCVQAFLTGWLTNNSISTDFRVNVLSCPAVSSALTSFESNLSIGERINATNYKGLILNLGKAMDVPFPLALAEYQRYFLATGQSNLKLTERALRQVIGQYVTIDLLWLQVFSPQWAQRWK